MSTAKPKTTAHSNERRAPPPAPRSAALRLVEPSTALAAADQAIAAAAAAPAPMQSRVISMRNEITARANDLSREREQYTERRGLLTAQYEAALKGLDENIGDIDAALAVLNEGIAVKQAAE